MKAVIFTSMMSMTMASFCAMGAVEADKAAPRKAPDVSVVVDGQLLRGKAQAVGDRVYVDVKELARILDWKVDVSDATLVVQTKNGVVAGTVSLSLLEFLRISASFLRREPPAL